MVAFEELNTQNHKLTELSNMLLYLFQDRSMCDTETACALLNSFLDQFDEHVGLVGHLYQGLLTDKDEKANNAARMFMSGEQELKRIIDQYSRRWCHTKRNGIRVADHAQFKEDTAELFGLVLARVQDETENLYPLVREIQGDSRSAA